MSETVSSMRCHRRRNIGGDRRLADAALRRDHDETARVRGISRSAPGVAGAIGGSRRGLITAHPRDGLQSVSYRRPAPRRAPTAARCRISVDSECGEDRRLWAPVQPVTCSNRTASRGSGRTPPPSVGPSQDLGRPRYLELLGAGPGSEQHPEARVGLHDRLRAQVGLRPGRHLRRSVLPWRGHRTAGTTQGLGVHGQLSSSLASGRCWRDRAAGSSAALGQQGQASRLRCFHDQRVFGAPRR
jgi:hypothetical protein